MDESVMSNSAPNRPGGEKQVRKVPAWLRLGVGSILFVLLSLFVTDHLFNPGKFQITDIEINGKLKNIDVDQIKRVVESEIDGNYFSVSLESLETKIEQLPWAFSASLRRRWPSTLLVEVKEIQPVAIWAESQWLNFTGDLVAIQPTEKHQFDELPQLYGPQSEVKSIWSFFRRWSGAFASTGLSLEGLTLDTSGLWHLELSLGALSLSQDNLAETEASEKKPTVRMIVDRELSSDRIDRFVRTLNQHLIVQFPFMQSIDLRYPNGFAIGWIDGQQPVSQIVSRTTLESAASN
jgi:cell division protein FtsQ